MEKRKKSGNKEGSKNGPSTSRRNLSAESEALAAKDDRFAHILKNPIYRGVPKKEKKVDIDKRFQSMFSDDKFKLKYKVDKRGRPVNTSTDENLAKYYNLLDDEENSDEEKPEIKEEPKSEDEDSSSGDEKKIKVESDLEESDIGKSSSKIKLSEDVRKKLRDADIDYARGEGDFVSEESSDDDSSSAEEESDVEHEWGEMDKESSRTEDSTNRLALCNMDWDRLKAVDLMVLFTSFLPAGGVLKTISIYTSEYGKKRMAEEELQGPLELQEFKREMNSDDEEETVIDYGGSDHDDEDEGSAYHREKLRKYQLNRLKYFYAVLEFDSKETAETVYSECDGREYESSAAKIDLRFIPDDMTFDEKPRDRSDTLPESGKYRPKFFTTTALQQVKVDCTWDETDPSRKDMIDRVFNSTDKVDDEDIKAYLASSSESDEDEETLEQGENGSDDQASVSIADPIAKYRALLDSIEKTEKKKKEKDVEMEITWGVGIKKKTEDLVKKKLEEGDGKMTPWEEQLAKLKEKRKLKKVSKNKKSAESDSDSQDSDEDDEPFSDDDVDVDMQDEFFQDEMRNNEIFKNSKKPKNKTKKEHKNDNNSDPKSNAELELLLMDDEGHKNHFNLKKIIEGENDSKSKKKRKFKKAKKDSTVKPDAKDDFDVNVGDDRFSALFTSHHYNIDPSDPNFKKTNAMEKIISEKQKRRTKGDFDEEVPGSKARKTMESTEVQHSQQSATKKAELSYLVKSIKRNTMNIRKVKQQKRQKS